MEIKVLMKETSANIMSELTVRGG